MNPEEKNKPYITEKENDKIENTNSFVFSQDMLVDDSPSQLSKFENMIEKKPDLNSIKSFVEIKVEEETPQITYQPILEEKKSKKKLGANLIISSLCFIPALIVLIFIGSNSQELILKPIYYTCIGLLFLFSILFLIGLIFYYQKNDKKPVKGKVFNILFSIFTVFYVMGCSSFVYIMYGPYDGFRGWLIPTAMTTMNHRYFATWFYSNDQIEDVLSQNVVIESGEDTDLNLITVGNIDFTSTTYANEYEKEILSKNSDNDVYKIIEVSGSGYKGYLVAVYDPSRISVATTKYLQVNGQYVTDMAADNNALLAINGGGFVDPNYSSSGGTPQGIVIQNGKVVSNRIYSKSGGLIGFTNDNKLVLGKMTATEAINKGVRDAVTFGPFLIVNGTRSFIKGNGGWGTAPRTAIGQRKDGIVLLLVIDGRTLKNPGADMADLTDIMERYGAYNAANLDGGTSSVLVFPEKVSKQYLKTNELETHCTNKYCYINDPIDGGGNHETRWVATSFIVK